MDLAPTTNVLSCDRINYTVKVKQSPCAKETDKQILHQVTGIFKPGLNAILGATGSGKTSFLDVLAARKDPAGLDGHILVNGQPMPDNFKCISGYVPQDDIVLGTLTVRENIYFSAKLRLPDDIPDKRKWEMVDDVIKELGLAHVANTKVGTALARGVSGGERKRTCIGMELVITPKVLFLDEPTTGLDSSTAGSVIELLHKLSRRGRTIIFSIHQPRYTIFKLFDRMMLLARGRVMYHGSADQVLSYFSSIGYECEEHDNPADFILDVINGDVTPQEADSDRVDLHSNDKAANGHTNVAFVDETGSVSSDHQAPAATRVISQVSYMSQTSKTENEIDVDREELAKMNGDKYKESRWHEEVRSEVDPIFQEFRSTAHLNNSNNKDKTDASNYYQLSFLKQLYTLSRRTSLSLRRDPFASVMQLAVISFFALFIGFIYFDLDHTISTGIQNRTGVFFFIITNQVFMNLDALELFIKERVMFVHENATGFYRVSVYFISKICFDLIPLRILPVIGFSSIVYFMLDLRFTVAKFFIFMLNLMVTTMCGAGFCFMYSSLFGIYAVVNLMCTLTFVLMMVFGGFMINVDDIWVGVRWLQYLSIFRYSQNTLMILELKDITLCGETLDSNNQTVEYCDPDAGNDYLETNGISYETSWDLWQNPMALAIIMFGTLIVTYIRLVTMNKYK